MHKPRMYLHRQSNNAISPQRRQWIAQRAQQLRQQYPSPLGAAMDMVWLLTQMEQSANYPRVRLRLMQGLYGAKKVEALTIYQPQSNQYLIVMDSSRLEYPFCTSRARRANFTLAHELGHVMLGHADLPDEVLTLGLRQQHELQADEFAGCLLMPQALMIRSQMQDMAQVATYYQVSTSALWQRLNNLGRLDMMRPVQRRRPCCTTCGNLRYNLWQSSYCAICGQLVVSPSFGVVPTHYIPDVIGDNACIQCRRTLPGFARFCDACGAPGSLFDQGGLVPWYVAMQAPQP